MRIGLRNTLLGLAGAAVVGAFLGTASAYAMGDASSFRYERNAGYAQPQASDSGKSAADQSAQSSFSDSETATSSRTPGARSGSDWYLPADHLGGR